ncbi:MAG: M28 family peptidase [bacterium]
MKVLRNILILLFVLNGFLPAQTETNIINEVVQSVNIDSLLFYVKELTGEVDVMINNQPVRILSRHKNNPDNAKAADYLYQKLTAYNLPVYKQDFSSTGRNIFAVQQGNKYPNQKVIICAHYDSQPAGSLAPGADDNASGTAAVIEAARILKGYNFPFTIIYAVWDEEEQGLIGSKYYADSSAVVGDSIIAVINMDMISYNLSNSNIVEINTSSVANSIELAYRMSELNANLNLGLSPVIKNPGSTSSDHASFWTNNYTAIELIESHGEFNPYYHTIGDTVGNFNVPYFHKCAKLSIASLLVYALNYNIKLQHLVISSTNQTNLITGYVDVSSDLKIAANNSAPTLYYRLNNGNGFGNFFQIKGISEKIKDRYNFIFPEIELGNIVEYYIAVQDSASSVVSSLPTGAKGYNPPGRIPPANMYKFFVASTTDLFADNILNADNWVFSGTAGLTELKYTSAPYSLTDSPDGNYIANADSKIKMTNPIHIPDALGAVLSYKAQWQLEFGVDYVQVQLSTNNGTNWGGLTGKYTKPGGGGFQPVNRPVYNGEQLEWVEESIDLSYYLGQDILIQFVLKSDANNQKDGFYVDDLFIKSYEKFTSVEDNSINIIGFKLNQNYPNPFNGQTIISFNLPVEGITSLVVYDILGKQVASIVNDRLNSGNHSYNFNASNLSSGVYFYTLITEGYTSTRKLVLLK